MGHGRTRPASDEQLDLTIADIEVDDLTHVIALNGEADFYAAPDFKEHVRRAIDHGKRRLVVDLSQVRFVDSAALGVLFGALKRLRALRGELAIVCRDPDIYSLFETVGLDSAFALWPTRREALRALAGSG